MEMAAPSSACKLPKRCVVSLSMADPLDTRGPKQHHNTHPRPVHKGNMTGRRGDEAAETPLLCQTEGGWRRFCAWFVVSFFHRGVFRAISTTPGEMKTATTTHSMRSSGDVPMQLKQDKIASYREMAHFSPAQLWFVVRRALSWCKVGLPARHPSAFPSIGLFWVLRVSPVGSRSPTALRQHKTPHISTRPLAPLAVGAVLLQSVSHGRM